MRQPSLVVLLALLLAAPVAAQQPAAAPSGGPTLALVPYPRELAHRPAISLADGVTVEAPGGDEADRFAAAELEDELRRRGVKVGDATGAVHIRLLRRDGATGRALLARHRIAFDSAMAAEGYVLVADAGRVDVIGASAPGVFYGAQTVKQLVEGRGRAATLHGAVIRDWPALRYRGLHDDVSRGPLPTLEFQKKQIRIFAAYKINVYSPYFEHTLAYRKHPLIAPPGGAMTADDVRELVAYAARHHVEVVPEQQTFGHLHHVLKLETYAPLAETPHGHVLAPGQAGTLPLVKDWFTEIAELFPSRLVHLGADETFELGRGQTADRVAKEGIGPVYLGYLKQVEATLRPIMPGRRFLFWGDIAMNHPELVSTLPKDMIAVAWQYNPRSDGFARYITPFTEAGIETWVATGVNNWNRVYPNFALALPNIQQFTRDAQRLGATGQMNTSWDDDGDALFAQTWYAVLFGAAAAWQPGQSSIERYQASYGRVFHGDTTGRIDEAQRKLMAAHQVLQRVGAGEASTRLFWMDPWSPDGRTMSGVVLPAARELRLNAEAAITLIAQARAADSTLRETEALDAMELGARRIALIGMNFQFADEAVRAFERAYAAQSNASRRAANIRDLADLSGINGRFQDLRDAYSLTRDLYERAWLNENRPYWLGNVLARFDIATQRWIVRADQATEARLLWQRTGKLRPAGELGLPVK